MAKVNVSRADVTEGEAIIDFSNGSTGVFAADFLLDNISRNGNQDITDLGLREAKKPKQKETQ